MSTIPRIVTRSTGLVEMVLYNQPDIQGWVVGAANTLNTAAAGVNTLFQIQRGSSYLSRTIRVKRIGLSDTSNRGLSRALYDPEDFWQPGSTIPHDYEVAFLRVSEIAQDGVVRPPGPILVLPSMGFYTNTRPKLTLSGTAPNLSSSATGNPPPGALHFALPRYADACTCINSGAHPLFISFAKGEPEFQIPSGIGPVYFNDGVMSEIYVRSSGGTTDFQMFFAIVNAEMA